MDALVLLGRILFSMVFIGSGINHLAKGPYMSEYAKSMGVPGAATAVKSSGVAILLGGFMIATGLWGDAGAVLILAFLVPTTIYMHPFWKIEHAEQRQVQQAMFMKNLSMAGGALALLGWFACDGGLSLTRPLFL